MERLLGSCMHVNWYGCTYTLVFDEQPFCVWLWHIIIYYILLVVFFIWSPVVYHRPLLDRTSCSSLRNVNKINQKRFCKVYSCAIKSWLFREIIYMEHRNSICTVYSYLKISTIIFWSLWYSDINIRIRMFFLLFFKWGHTILTSVLLTSVA